MLAGSDTRAVRARLDRSASSSVEVLNDQPDHRSPVVAISKVEPISFPGGDGLESHAYFYPPLRTTTSSRQRARSLR